MWTACDEASSRSLSPRPVSRRCERATPALRPTEACARAHPTDRLERLTQTQTRCTFMGSTLGSGGIRRRPVHMCVCVPSPPPDLPAPLPVRAQPVRCSRARAGLDAPKRAG